MIRGWVWRHPRRLVAAVVLLSTVAINVVAYLHARAMTNFATTGQRTPSPERLSTAEKAGIMLTGITLPRPATEQTPADYGLDYETLTIPGAEGIHLEAWRMACRESRVVVVLFHGYSACKSSLLAEAHALHELGCEAWLVDFRGSGGSSGDVTTLGVYESDDVVQAFGFVRRLDSSRPLILYGRSMGSAAILRAVSRDAIQPDGTILECPFDRLVTTVGNRFTALGLPTFPMTQLLVFWGGVQHGMNGFTHNPVDYAADVRCPTLVLHGSLDPRVSVTEVESVHANLAGEKQFTLFPRAAHQSYLRVDPELWTRTIADFLERHGSSRG